MAKLVFISTNSAVMHTIEIVAGQVLYCADIPETYYDTTSGNRVILDKVVYSYADSDRLSIPAERLSSETLYVVTSTGSFYKWSLATEWVPVWYTADLYNVIDLVENLVPSTITQYGTSVAPRTLATQVFTKDGERVEDLLGDITRIGKTYRYIEVETEGQTEFDLPLPFNNYFELGNYIELYVGSVWISPKRYNVVTDASTPVSTVKLVFNEVEDILEVGREISVVYTYNTARAKDTVYAGVNGNYIVDGTIPIRKMAKSSDDYLLNDGSSVATSKAVFNAYNSVNEKLNMVAGNLIAYAISYNTGFELKADVENYTLVDNSTIYLKLHTDIATGATLSLNGSQPIPIYLNYKEMIKSGLKEGDVISLTYSKMYGKFFVNSSMAYRLAHFRQTYECYGGDSTIAIDIPEFQPGSDNLHVSHNNLKLYEGINYTIDGHNLILNYSASAGDIIEIEFDKVMGNGLPVDGNTIMKEMVFTEQAIFKGDAVFEGHMTLPNGGSLDELGNLTINGNIIATKNISGHQLISTAEDGIPPLVVASTTVISNLNADMVDNYHASDLAIPDKSLEFIIDGESDIMDPSIHIMLQSFLSRINAIEERMIVTDSTDLVEPIKRSYIEEYGEGYEWPENEPLSNENVRDTIEYTIYQLDSLNFRVLSTESTDELGIDIDLINDMRGDEYINDDPMIPEQTPLLTNWVDMVNLIDTTLLDIEERILTTAYEATNDATILEEYQKVKDSIANWVPYEGLEDSNNSEDGETTSSASALRAMYVRTDGKRFYPITHRNAVIGLPFGNLATEKSVTTLEDYAKSLESRIAYLEDIVQMLINGGGGELGSCLAMFEGLKVPVPES